MKNFIFKSTEADLQKMFSIIENTQKNVLYLTHQVDFIRKLLNEAKHDKDLQQTVDKYFEDDRNDIPEKEPDPAELD